MSVSCRPRRTLRQASGQRAGLCSKINRAANPSGFRRKLSDDPKIAGTTEDEARDARRGTACWASRIPLGPPETGDGAPGYQQTTATVKPSLAGLPELLSVSTETRLPLILVAISPMESLIVATAAHALTSRLNVIV
jgi:hypothetical protein